MRLGPTFITVLHARKYKKKHAVLHTASPKLSPEMHTPWRLFQGRFTLLNTVFHNSRGKKTTFFFFPPTFLLSKTRCISNLGGVIKYSIFRVQWNLYLHLYNLFLSIWCATEKHTASTFSCFSPNKPRNKVVKLLWECSTLLFWSTLRGVQISCGKTVRVASQSCFQKWCLGSKSKWGGMFLSGIDMLIRSARNYCSAIIKNNNSNDHIYSICLCCQWCSLIANLAIFAVCCVS